MDELYEQHKNLIYKFVNKIYPVAKRYGVQESELISEGNRIFMRCAERYEPRKAKFSTYLYRCLHFGLYRMIRKEIKRLHRETSIESMMLSQEFRLSDRNAFLNGNEPNEETGELPSKDNFEEKILFDVTLESLSRDARQCVEIAFDPPEEIKEIMSERQSLKWRNKVNKPVIQKYLKSMGWKQARINHAFVEVNVAFLT